jgi:hypothetical protein
MADETPSISLRISQTIFFTVLGLASGVLTSLLSSTPITIYPGLLFGIAISVFFFMSGKEKRGWRLGVFTAISTGAYVVAFYTTFFFLAFTDHNLVNGSQSYYDPVLFLGLLIGGLVGALILSVGINFLLAKLTDVQLFALTALGGFLGFFGFVVGYLFLPVFHSGATFYTLFIIWQTGMAFALAFCVKE